MKRLFTTIDIADYMFNFTKNVFWNNSRSLEGFERIWFNSGWSLFLPNYCKIALGLSQIYYDVGILVKIIPFQYRGLFYKFSGFTKYVQLYSILHKIRLLFFKHLVKEK